MQKGKFGFYLWYYPLVAFILAFLGQILLVAVLLLFVIAVEKDEWAIRQNMQAFGMSFIYLLINGLYSYGYTASGLNYFNYYSGSYDFSVNVVFGYIAIVVAGILAIGALIFFIMALTRVVKGRDAGIPILSSVVDKVFGVVKQQPFYQQPPVGGPGQPNYGAQQPQPPTYAQPQQPNYSAPAAPTANPYAPPQAQEPAGPQIPPQDNNPL